MKRDPQRQVGENEAILRDVNEAIERGHWPGDNDASIAFRCECAELGCSRMIELSVSEYERVRANPRWFFIAAEHQPPEPEVVVESHGHYLIVEKLDDAGRVAEEANPRSRAD